MFGWPKRPQSDFSSELRSHIELEAERLRAGGFSGEEARLRARKAFGNVLQAEERFYESNRLVFVESIARDLRDAFRGLRRAPAFTALALAALAVGIGACTAVFSLVDRLLFRGLPYPRAERLVSVGITGPIDTNEFMIGRTYFDWKLRPSPFASLTSMLPAGQCDLGDRDPVRIHCIFVEANFLRTLGIRPQLGRDFVKEDDLPNAPRLALISYGLWQSRFAGAARVLGQTIRLDDRPARIAGVLPRTFEMPQLGEADILVPEQLDEAAQRRAGTGAFLRCFARLKDGITLDQARAEMQPLFRSAVNDAPPMLRNEIHLALRSLRDRQIHDVRLASWTLLGLVGALLLISCGNVANLLLARAATRRRELAMRAALGASRARLIQRSVVESLVLALFGGMAGSALAYLMVRILIAVSPDAIVRLNQAAIDGRALAFTLFASLAAAMLFGVTPALEPPRAASLLGWHSIGAQRGGIRRALVAFQVAVSLILLTGATLFARSLAKLESQPLGLSPERVITASFVLGVHRYGQPAAQDALYRELESRLAGIPGVRGFALSDSVPPAGGMHARPFSNLRIAGHPPVSSEGGLVAFRYVTPDYFGALRIRITAGRAFVQADRLASQPPLILSASLARKLFPNENPVGQQIALGAEVNGRPLYSPVVGVAADVKNDGLTSAPAPEYYCLRTWNSEQLGRSAVAILRTSLAPETVVRVIRRELAALDPTLPVRIETLRERVRELTGRPRFVTVLVGLFAGFGLLLAAVGLYGVMSFLVGQRTREIGVRMALGAAPGQIASLMLLFAARWTAVGALAGLAGALLVTRLFRGLLFDVSPEDPASFAIAIAALLAAASLAAWFPSARAARVDPAVSLRED